MPELPEIDDDDDIGKWEEVKAEVEALIASYNAVQASEVPRSIKDAKKLGWVGVDALQLTAAQFYAPDTQREDSKRVVPFGALLEAMISFEDELVQSTIIKPESIWLNGFVVLGASVDFVLSELGKLLISYLTGDFRPFRGEALAWRYMTIILPLLGIKTLAEGMVNGQLLRHKVEARMRKKALPQGNQKRRYRRKITWTR